MILLMVITQDAPFLALRLLLLCKYNVASYMHIFFTVKNSLVLLLMTYRLYVVFDTVHEETKESNSIDGRSLNALHGQFIVNCQYNYNVMCICCKIAMSSSAQDVQPYWKTVYHPIMMRHIKTWAYTMLS